MNIHSSVYICASTFWIFAVDKVIHHNNSCDLIDMLSRCISQGLWFSLAPPCLLVSSGVSSVLSTIFTISDVQHLKQTLSLFFLFFPFILLQTLLNVEWCWHRHADRWHPLTFLHSGLPITFVLTSVPATFLLTKSVTLINPTNSASVN